jgi:hypothetical protein
MDFVDLYGMYGFVGVSAISIYFSRDKYKWLRKESKKLESVAFELES